MINVPAAVVLLFFARRPAGPGSTPGPPGPAGRGWPRRRPGWPGASPNNQRRKKIRHAGGSLNRPRETARGATVVLPVVGCPFWGLTPEIRIVLFFPRRRGGGISRRHCGLLSLHTSGPAATKCRPRSRANIMAIHSCPGRPWRRAPPAPKASTVFSVSLCGPPQFEDDTTPPGKLHAELHAFPDVLDGRTPRPGGVAVVKPSRGRGRGSGPRSRRTAAQPAIRAVRHAAVTDRVRRGALTNSACPKRLRGCGRGPCSASRAPSWRAHAERGARWAVRAGGWRAARRTPARVGNPRAVRRPGRQAPRRRHSSRGLMRLTLQPLQQPPPARRRDAAVGTPICET